MSKKKNLSFERNLPRSRSTKLKRKIYKKKKKIQILKLRQRTYKRKKRKNSQVRRSKRTYKRKKKKEFPSLKFETSLQKKKKEKNSQVWSSKRTYKRKKNPKSEVESKQPTKRKIQNEATCKRKKLSTRGNYKEKKFELEAEVELK